MSEQLPSTKPYLVRAIHEWCSDQGFTPYVSVLVDARTVVPREHVKDGQIVLNVGTAATGKLLINNEALQCTARFSGAAREIYVPMSQIIAIYARENGVGMGFELPDDAAPEMGDVTEPTVKEVLGDAPSASDDDDRPRPSGPPRLQRVK